MDRVPERVSQVVNEVSAKLISIGRHEAAAQALLSVDLFVPAIEAYLKVCLIKCV